MGGNGDKPLRERAGLDCGIGIVGKCLCLRRRSGLRKMAAKYFELTLAIANQSLGLMFYVL